jgi:hypothetical protein
MSEENSNLTTCDFEAADVSNGCPVSVHRYLVADRLLKRHSIRFAIAISPDVSPSPNWLQYATVLIPICSVGIIRIRLRC